MTDQRASHAQDLAVIGAGSYAAVMAELAESCGYRVSCYLDDNLSKCGTSLEEVPIRGPIDTVLQTLPPASAVAVAIGHNDLRLKWLIAARDLGHSVPALVSPQSIVSGSATVGDAVYVHPGAHVWTQAKLGFGSIVSPAATVAHHTELGEGCFVSSGARVGASIAVGRAAFFGIGSVTSTGISSVGEHTLVGAGAVVIRDTEPYGVYVGSPARLLRVMGRRPLKGGSRESKQ